MGKPPTDRPLTAGDDWIDHKGTGNPVPGLRVDVRRANGEEWSDWLSDQWGVDWFYDPNARSPDDIIAYRLARPATSAASEGAGDEPTPEQIEPFARQWCISNGIDPDEPTPPHGEWPRWYDEAGPFAAMWKTISAYLRTQAPDSWRPIETAPKDGTWVQAWRDPPSFTGTRWEPLIYVRWDEAEESWIWPCDMFEVFTVRGRELADMEIDEGAFYSSPDFTHWMPLPAAPALRTQTAESGT